MSSNHRKRFGHSTRARPVRRSTTCGVQLASILVTVVSAAALYTTRADAQTIEYLLSPASRIQQRCQDCRSGDRALQQLQGTFDLTVMPIPDAYAIEAVTAIRWYSDGFKISGTGFFQRQGRNRISLVIDAVVNGKPVLLTSSASPTNGEGGVHISLVSTPDSAMALEIELLARPNATDSPDADDDGVPDSLDLCPRHPDSQQFDSDRDGIGDACDRCLGTPLGSPVLADGCSPDQACPCAGPMPGVLWEDQHAYVTCIAQSLKILATADQISRAQVKERVHKAFRSGCGSPVIAMR